MMNGMQIYNICKKCVVSKLKWRHWLLLFLLATVVVFKTVPGLGGVYTASVYPKIGYVLSSFSGKFCFAVGDVFIALSVAWVVVYPLCNLWRKRRSWKQVSGRVAEYLLWVYVWFYAAWGLNYSQPNIYRRMAMKPVEVSEKEFRTFAFRYVDSLNVAWQGVTPDNKVSVESSVNESYRKIWGMTGRGVYGRHDMGINASFASFPPVKTMVFSRLCSMAGVTGSMAPFFCEFTLNADLRMHEYPATYAHELAHFLGVANEGEANFYSYVVCTSSNDRFVRFSGYYHILPHMAANVREVLGDKDYELFVKRVRPEVLALARSDRDYWVSRRCTAVDRVQGFFYDLYLRGNNVEGGVKSYSSVIAIIMAWEELTSTDSIPVP